MNFDLKAQDWDNDPKKIERAAVFAQEIKAFVTNQPTNHALEVGCGTGLLSFMLQDVFTKITLTDTSDGMMQVLKDKINQQGITHFYPQLIDVFESKANLNNIDVVYTLMTLHHIQDLHKAFKSFNELLKINGFICIADLVTEDGSFHDQFPDFDGHNGFNREELSAIMTQNGFEEVFYKIGYVIEKPLPQGIKSYPVFLMIGKKTG